MADDVKFFGTAFGCIVGVVIAMVFIIHPNNPPSSDSADANQPVHHLTLPGPQVDPRAAGLVRLIHAGKGVDANKYCLYIVRWTPQSVSGSAGKIHIRPLPVLGLSKSVRLFRASAPRDFYLTYVQVDSSRWQAIASFRRRFLELYARRHARSVMVCAAPSAYVDNLLSSATA